MSKLTTEEFIEKAKLVHGDRYDYSKVEYVNNSTKVCIICPNHGEFYQTPRIHLRGHGCPKCGGSKRLTNPEFVSKAISIHGNKYDYRKVEYVNNHTPICIICPTHGEFWQTPSSHLAGHGCPHCVPNEKMDTKSFIEKARKVHGDKYDYSLVDYKNSSTKVDIICKKHGIFKQTPGIHLRGHGCPKCRADYLSKLESMSTKEFVEKAKNIHGNKYDYSLVDYKNSSTLVNIICPIHGIFKQTPSSHLRNHGCPKCKADKNSRRSMKSLGDFIKKAKTIHGDKYDYSKVKYKGANRKVVIICPKHGAFEQRPSNHLNGQGCPLCNQSHGEKEIEKILRDKGICYIPQYNIELDNKLFSRNHLRIDFYIPSMNTFIEFNGRQHYEKNEHFHKTQEDFLVQVDRDKRLKQYCKRNKIKLIVIKYNQIDKINEILTRKLNIK